MGLLCRVLVHSLLAVPAATSSMDGRRTSPLEAHAAPLERHGAAAAPQTRLLGLRPPVAEPAEDAAQKPGVKPDAKTTGLRTAQRRAVPAAATHSAPVHVAQNSTSPLAGSQGQFTLLKAADACSCKFEDTCACDKLIGFMDCVVNACSSGRCDCHGLVFRDACATLGESCEGVHIMCSKKKAVCTHEDEGEHGKKHTINVTAAMSVEDIYGELKLLKQERCSVTSANADGWLNADKQLKGVVSKINKHMRELTARGAQLPEMHCEKHFEEWHDPPTPAPLQKGGAARILAAPALLVLVAATL